MSSSSQRHPHGHDHYSTTATSREELETQIVNDIFPTATRQHTTSTPTTTTTTRSSDPHLLSAIRETVHYLKQPPSNEPNDAPQRMNSTNPIMLGEPASMASSTHRSNSPFGDDHAETGSAVWQGGQASGESSGQVGKERVRFGSGYTTGALGPNRTIHTSDPSPSRIRRTHSSSEPTSPPRPPTIRLLSTEQKKPSRHADVIDKWDGTGLGKSMWHHSGPYDAAAPSRNDAKERGAERAPMAVFDPRKGSRVTELDGKALEGEIGAGQRPGHTRLRSGSISKMQQQQQHQQQAQTPDQELTLPTLPLTAGIPMTARPSRSGRKPSVSSPGIYGSLQDEYSTSVPTSGGYFPADLTHPGSAEVEGKGKRGSVSSDIEEKRMREKERELKRRALQAAWGIDEPEPFEDFSGYGQTEPVDLNEPYREREPVSAISNESSRPNRSPSKSGGGMSLGGLRRATSRSQGGNRSPLTPNGENGPEYFTVRPLEGDGQVSPGAGGNGLASTNAGGAKGVKRTRSLMQRFRAMRDNPNVPVNDDVPVANRSGSPAGAGGLAGGRHSPWNEDTLGIMKPAEQGANVTSATHPAQPPTLQLGQNGVKRHNSFLSRRKPSRNEVLPSSPNEAHEEILFGDSPVEPARVSPPRHRGYSNGYSSSATGQHRSRGLSGSGVGMGREKALPPPPPIQPVMPDFNDQFSDMTLKPPEQSGGGVQRKTSLMKKLKARIGS